MFGPENFPAPERNANAREQALYDPFCEDQEIMEMVSTAIRKKQVLLAFQPVIQTRDTSKAAFYEGLIRVLDASGRIIPAGAFMEAIEATDLGRQLDALALDKGLRTLFENPQLRISINMSARSINYAPWTRTLERWLSRDEALAERLIVEITESSALQAPELLIDFMGCHQKMGISFAMDDFGSGYTALRYFKDFNFDILKIDGQFIKGIARCSDNRAMTTALVSIAKHFDMMVVAEFVETQEDVETLSQMGVDCLQGYCFGAATTQPPWAQPLAIAQAV
ncbi:MAG: EAL domain-containing protein [Roseobacter sp.]